MKIVDHRGPVEAVPCGNLTPGTPFLYQDRLYLRIEDPKGQLVSDVDNGDLVFGVSVANGKLLRFYPETQVIKADVEVHINGVTG